MTVDATAAQLWIRTLPPGIVADGPGAAPPPAPTTISDPDDIADLAG